MHGCQRMPSSMSGFWLLRSSTTQHRASETLPILFGSLMVALSLLFLLLVLDSLLLFSSAFLSFLIFLTRTHTHTCTHTHIYTHAHTHVHINAHLPSFYFVCANIGGGHYTVLWSPESDVLTVSSIPVCPPLSENFPASSSSMLTSAPRHRSNSMETHPGFSGLLLSLFFLWCILI